MYSIIIRISHNHFVYKVVSSGRMSEVLFSITVERSGFPSSIFWSMVVGAEDVTGIFEAAFGL